MLAIFGTPSGGELLLVMLVVLLLFGAKNLPRMARTLGRTLEEFRRAAREVTDEIVHADDEDLKRPRALSLHPAPSEQDEPEDSHLDQSNPPAEPRQPDASLKTPTKDPA